MMCQLDYDQDALSLSGDHSTWSASMAKMRFTGYGVGQILTSQKKFNWPGLDRVGVRMPGGVLFWHKCLISSINFVKEETREMRQSISK